MSCMGVHEKRPHLVLGRGELEGGHEGGVEQALLDLGQEGSMVLRVVPCLAVHK